MLSVIFNFLPWYAWLGLILVVVLLVYTGLLPVVITFLRTVPWQVWAILATGLALWFWLRTHDAALTKKVTDERNAYWQAREDKANADYKLALGALQLKLDTSLSTARAAAERHAAELAAKETKRRAAVTALALERKKNVTAKANADCQLTRGVILQFNKGAASANGSDVAEAAGPAGAGSESVDAPAGITLDQLVAGVNATQAALGTCRDQVVGWQTYHANVVKPWITSTLDALSTCIPKGSTP